MANILIVTCSKDDDDGEMAQMANSIDAFLTNKGDTTTVVDLEKLPYPGNKLDIFRGYDRVIFTGHSRFFENATQWNAKKYVCRPLANRRVGGYPPEVIAGVVANLVKHARITDFMFCCCEIATNVDTHTREDGGSGQETVNLPSNALVEMYLKKQDGEDQVSLLAWIGVLTRKALTDMSWRGDVTLGGLNGVGYIVEDNPAFLTFSQEYLNKFRTILKRQEKAKTLKGDDEFLQGYVLNPDRKKSTHVLTFNVSIP